MREEGCIIEAPFLMDLLRNQSPWEKQALEGISLFDADFFEGPQHNIVPFERGKVLSHSIAVGKNIRFQNIPPHRHDFVEMCYVCSGELVHEINGSEVRMYPGDMLLLNQYTAHSVRQCGEKDIAVNFHIHPRFFDETYELAAKSNILSDFIVDILRGSMHCNQYLVFSTKNHLPVHHLMEMLLCTAFPHSDEICPQTGDTPSTIIQSLMFLVIYYLSHDLSKLRQGSLTYEQVMIQTVETFINESYPTATLRELAGMLNQTESGLSRQIRSIFGATFKELLQARRFERALVLLKETNLPVSDIALMVGYENSSYFYRRFREIYMISPGEFRDQCQRGDL